MTLEALATANLICGQMAKLESVIDDVNKILDNHGDYPIEMRFNLTTKDDEFWFRESRESEKYQGFMVHCLMNYKKMLEHELDDLADELENL